MRDAAGIGSFWLARPECFAHAWFDLHAPASTAGRCSCGRVFSCRLRCDRAGGQSAAEDFRLAGDLVYVGSNYSFRPTASDPERKTLRFTVANKPAWATFSTSNGRLSGTPKAVGYWTNIQISVSDGVNTTSLPAFALRATSKSNVAPTISGRRRPRSSPTRHTASYRPRVTPTAICCVSASRTSPSWASSARRPAVERHADGGSGRHLLEHRDRVERRLAHCIAAGVQRQGHCACAANRAPTISGTPATSVTVGQAYSFSRRRAILTATRSASRSRTVRPGRRSTLRRVSCRARRPLRMSAATRTS